MTVWVVALSLSLYHRNNNYPATNSNYDSHPEGDGVRTEDEVDGDTKHSSHVGAEGFVFVILCRQQCRCRVDSRASLKLKPIRRRPDINEPPLLPANYYLLKPSGIQEDRIGAICMESNFNRQIVESL